MAEPLIPDTPTAVVDAELMETMAGPAIHSNKFYISTLPSGMRIAFAESMPGVDPQFRFAALIGYADAIALRDLLTQQLRHIEPQIKEAQAAAAPQAAEAGQAGQKNVR